MGHEYPPVRGNQHHDGQFVCRRPGATAIVDQSVRRLHTRRYGRCGGDTRPPERLNVLNASGAPTISVMDLKGTMALDPPPPGWLHRTF